MKIRQIEIYRLNIPLKAPVQIAIGTITESRNILVKILTDEGLYGLGEGSPFRMIVGETQDTCLAAAKELAGLLIGKNPLDIEGNMSLLNRYLERNYTCKSAFDMALYDLAGKSCGLPLYRLLGGKKKPVVTDETIYIGSPEVMSADAAEIRKKGAGAVKLKLGTDVTTDIARVKAVREVIGPVIPIRVDANQGWQYTEAVAVLSAIAPFDIEYCEQPLKHWDHEGLARLRNRVPVPICADESLFTDTDALRLIRMQAADYFNIKLSKSGGIYTALKINALAEAAGIPCMIGCMSESRLAISACAHLASSRENICFYDLDAPFEHAVDPVTGGAVYHDHYRLELPDSPGHGADIDGDFLKKMDRQLIN